MKKKISITQIIRHIIQLGAFLLFPGMFISIFMAIRNLYTAAIGVSTYQNQWLLILAIFPITVLFGRFFCGYLCAFGAMGDLLWWISSKIIKKPIRVNEKVDCILKYLKYVVLALIVIFAWTLAIPMDSTYSPWNVFGMYSTLSGWSSVKALLSVGGLLLLLIIIGCFLIERFFCRYLCPLGAIFAMVSRFRLHRMKKPGDECGACRMCTGKCSMGIPLYKEDRVNSSECINCYRCVDVCPRKNVTSALPPVVLGTATALGMAGIYFLGTLSLPTENKDGVSGPGTITENTDSLSDIINSNNYQDGVYTGTGSGFRGDITVEVTVEGGQITAITVVSSNDDKQFFDRAKSSIISDIISNQSVEVDAVSGATFSSNGIIEAVANALDISYTNPNSESPKRGHGNKGKGGQK